MIFSQKIRSPLGMMTACSTEDGICLLAFDRDKGWEKEYSILEKNFGSPFCDGWNEHLKTLVRELDEYFRGTLRVFSVPLVTTGTAFQKSVWKELMNIGYGETRSYLEQSMALGKPESIRAVANANGINRISIIIPCHRVIGSNGSLTGYGGGLERKKWLLEHEKRYSGKSYEPVLF